MENKAYDQQGRSPLDSQTLKQNVDGRSKAKSKNGSLTSKTSSRRLEIATEVAKLQTELDFHDIETKTTEEIKRREAELAKIRKQKELALAQATLDAVSRYSEESLETDSLAGLKDGRPEQMDQYLQDQAAWSLLNLHGQTMEVCTSNSGNQGQVNNFVDSPMNEEYPQVKHKTCFPLPTSSQDVIIDQTKTIHQDGLDIRRPQQNHLKNPSTIHNDLRHVEDLSHARRSSPEREDYPETKANCSSCSTKSGEDAMMKLIDLMRERQVLEGLPKPEPDIFSGDLTKFLFWKRSYETLVESRVKDPQQRLYYLSKYVGGEAKEAIKGLLSLNTEDAYSKAKDILIERYGNQFLTAEQYMENLRAFQKIAPNDGPALRKFADFLHNLETAMLDLQDLNVLNSNSEVKKILAKLPNYLIRGWGKIADEYICRNTRPPFSRLVSFLNTQARIANNPVTTLKPVKDYQYKDERRGTVDKKKHYTSLATNGTEEKGDTCSYCSNKHSINDCYNFKRISLADRRKFVKNERLCGGCFKHGHIRKFCKNRQTCEKCQRSHPTLLHDEDFLKKYQEREEKKPETETGQGSRKKIVSNCVGSDSSNWSHSLIVPVWLFHEDKPEHKILAYALEDDQSDGTFIKVSAVEKLQLDGPRVELSLSTMLDKALITSKKITGLVMKGYYEDTLVNLPQAYSRDVIPAKRSQIPRRETALKYPHLRRISDEIMPYDKDVEISLLIGLNCSNALKPRDVILGEEDDPYAIKTNIGWGIVGNINPEGRFHDEDDDNMYVNKIMTREVEMGEERKKLCHFAMKTQVKEVINPYLVNQMFEMDFVENQNREPYSHEDKKFIKKLSNNIQRDNGHYQLPLPFKDENTSLPNNRNMVLKRTLKLRHRMIHDAKYREDYEGFMKKTIENGYAEKVPPSDILNKNVWFIPHHGIYHPKKPGKIRIVYDCSAEFEKVSLNKVLLQGPDLTNSLLGVLCRFRQEEIAFMCDIEGMFHQVSVDPKHRDYLRFFWWENGNYDQQPAEYRMTVHLFGAISSPACANFALKTMADDYESIFGEEASNFVRKNFYVDDGLKSVPTEEEAIDLILKTTKLCEKARFHLHKFVSNSKAVLDVVPKSDCTIEVKNLNLGEENIERALGVQWCLENDHLRFRIEVNDKPFTRRGILSTVSSIFDPLGLVSPFVLVGKKILQDLCKDGGEWDDEIPEQYRIRWERWREEIFSLHDLKFKRCYKPPGFGEVVLAELHHFSDASQSGYGQCSYLRLKNAEDMVHCSLVLAKSRVTPSKPITIPRLELTAAVVSVRMSNILNKELEYKQIKNVFWTDSEVVLGYIRNEARRFHVFVANRIQSIRDHTIPDQWNHIEGSLNVADIASRGSSAKDLVKSINWWNGPDFLWQTTIPEPNNKANLGSLSEEDPEVKKITTLATNVVKYPSLSCRLEYFSNWHTMKRAIATCLRLQMILKSKKGFKDKENKYLPISIEEMREAEKEILRIVQFENFAEEIRRLKKEKNSEELKNRDAVKKKKLELKKSSMLAKLDPFLDESGLLRVGGRITSQDIPFEQRHPIILPRKSHVTKILIEYFHRRIQHQGRGMTQNEVRSNGFWIIGGSSAVSYHIAKCIPCIKYRSRCQEQKMSNLPNDRVEPSAPFTYCAVDYFGPWKIKEGRKELKRYGVIFTCLSSRAVHLETAKTMDTDSFLNCYRRFVCRRGPVRQLRCDQGSNFIGAKNELNKEFEKQIRNGLTKENCELIPFKMNVPESSHMGGVWERQIRSVRNVLSVLLTNHGTQLDDESLNTFMTEAEAIVNSRPLSVDDINTPGELSPLTPNNLLTMKTKILMPPPGEFQRLDLYVKKRWRRVQHLSNEFWKRWSKDYLQSLQSRQKWTHKQRNLQIDDIVIIKNDNLPRNEWCLGRVIEIFPEEDNLVRKVKLAIADRDLSKDGKRLNPVKYLERPIHKLILLISKDE